MSCFKIVTTQERQGIYFSVVPSLWEKDGILLWPEHLNHSQREVLRSNSNSEPEEGWLEYTCILKFTGISNFKEALKIEKQLTMCSDTDAEEALFSAVKSKKRCRNKPANNDHNQLTDRNDLFNEYFDSNGSQLANSKINRAPALMVNSATSQVPPDVAPLPEVTIINNTADDQLFKTILLDADGSFNFNALNQTIPNVLDEINSIKNDISILKNELGTFKEEIKQQLKEDYSKINVSLDKIFRILSSQDQPRREIPATVVKEDLLKDVKFPLETCEEITLFEKKIRNDEFRTQLIDFLSKIGGKTGVEDGTKIAYKIVDCVFKSSVLMKYSWTGVSRDKSGEKKAFQTLEGILRVFFEVILLADNRHTFKKNCSIFKDGILKHAKKRNTRKQIVPRAGDQNINNNNDDLPENNTETEENRGNILETSDKENELDGDAESSS